MNSTLQTKEILEKYTKVVSKLKSELQSITLDDHLWFHGIIGKLYCAECNNDFGSKSGDHSTTTINNVFAKVKESCIMSNMHINCWCRRKCINFYDHPQCMATKGKHVVLTTLDHKATMTEGLAIMHKVSTSIYPIEGPFVAISDLKDFEVKSLWFKANARFVVIFSSFVHPRRTWLLV